MGIQAVYMSVDNATYDRLAEASSEDLFDEIEELEESDCPLVGLEKMWDGLHFLLTGVSASEPIEGNPLSEAVVGVHVFEGEDYIACTERDALPGILAALDAVLIDDLLGAADFGLFRKAGLYPEIWTDDPAQLKVELAEAFQALHTFYRQCVAAQRHVIVSIY